MNSKKVFTFAIIATLFESVVAHADNLATGSRIVKVTNSRSAGDPAFVVLTEGGTGPCIGNWIGFPQTIAGVSDAEMQKKAYAAALLALSTGMRVDIVANDNNCWAAFFVAVYP